jgi:hypothetical protein
MVSSKFSQRKEENFAKKLLGQMCWKEKTLVGDKTVGKFTAAINVGLST